MIRFPHRLPAFYLAACSPESLAPKKCTKPAQRRAWHTLRNSEKKAYLDAEACVMKTPSKIAIPGARSQFDELVAIHQLIALTIHSTGVFLPWHRWYLNLHEVMLKGCGYTGATPYWDEIRDATLVNIISSAIYDPVTGFGGGGVAPTYCTTTGPFANYTNSIGPNYLATDGCIGRNFVGNPLREMNATAEANRCMTLTTYDEAWVCIYMIPHLAGRISMSSLRPDPLTSPTEPAFYMHHAYVDKMWWDWQEKGPPQLTLGGRKTQPAGPRAGLPRDPRQQGGGVGAHLRGPVGRAAAVDPGRHGGRTWQRGDAEPHPHFVRPHPRRHIPDATVRDVMDTRGGYLCYEYV
ncbi:hypothetical protein B0T22DRAFT_502113 [Podospora appendiculata]|uniref:Tyrosinase copper-binding domain-containing protein n=1 Tax=Podospora appendiculata TaxID=314037 RepID=A0AAE0X2E2_9PEZI|nr:hypothetical protein B0T22DRAFT_502113 [Podospora appendiculata]